MKKYYLEVVEGGFIRGYEVIADYFDWSNSGCYIFYTKDKGKSTIVSTYPISRTIIKQIEDVND